MTSPAVRDVASPPPLDPACPALAVIGGGQLARMMAQSAVALGVPLRLLAEGPDVSAAQVVPDTLVGDYRDLDMLRKIAEGCSVVTFDHEHVPPSTCTTWPRRATPAGPGPRPWCTRRTRA